MQLFANACPWYIAGPLLGLLVAGLLWAINKPLGALGGYVDTVQWVADKGAAPSWRALFLVGIVVGVALFGYLKRRRETAPAPPRSRHLAGPEPGP
jgi:drug/metabolite transporter (DMT)-like permease